MGSDPVFRLLIQRPTIRPLSEWCAASIAHLSIGRKRFQNLPGVFGKAGENGNPSGPRRRNAIRKGRRLDQVGSIISGGPDRHDPAHAVPHLATSHGRSRFRFLSAMTCPRPKVHQISDTLSPDSVDPVPPLIPLNTSSRDAKGGGSFLCPTAHMGTVRSGLDRRTPDAIGFVASVDENLWLFQMP